MGPGLRHVRHQQYIQTAITNILPLDPERPKGPGKNGQQAKYVAQPESERNKFVDLDHQLLPPRIDAWSSALAGVDRSRPAPGRDDSWRYWVPDPAVLVTPGKDDRLVRYIRNWLRIRIPWYWIVERADKRLRPMNLKVWRELLNFDHHTVHDLTQNTFAAERKRRVYQHFTAVFGEDNLLYSDSDVEWFGAIVRVLEPKTVQQVAWEVCHIGFRIELRHLDRTLVREPLPSIDCEICRDLEEHRDRLLQEVFAGRPLTSDTLPTVNTGLEAEDVRDHAASLDALRRLVLRWPEVPNAVRDCPTLTSKIGRAHV